MTDIHIQPIDPERFHAYGRVLLAPAGEPTAADKTFSYWSDLARWHIEGETEIGLCTVYRTNPARVTWVERHARTPEILIPVDEPFLLPVLRDDADDAGLEAYCVDVGEAVVIGQGVWHSACHPADADEATYFVIFRRGTPQEDVEKKSVSGVQLRPIPEDA